MSTVPFSYLYDHIAPKCMLAPQPAIDTAILDAARTFCRNSRWRQQSIPVNAAIGKSWYPVVPPNTDEEVIRLEYLQYNGQSRPLPLSPVAPADTSGVQSCFTGFFYEPPNWLVILPAPTASLMAGYYVRAVLQPTKTATTLDYTIVQQWDDTIAEGALAFLFGTNDCEWSDPKKAEVAEAAFNAGIGRAAAARQTNFTSGPLLTAVPRF